MPLDVLLRLLSGAPPVTIKYNLCVHNLSPRASCRRCVDNCPGGAVTAPGVVTPDKCLRCGLCQTLCPTGAFSLTPAVRRQLYQPPAAARTLLGCSRQLPALAPARDWQVLRVPCLAIFSVGWLLARALAGPLYICQDVTLCRICPSQQGGELFADRLQHVARLLAGAPHTLQQRATPEALGLRPVAAEQQTNAQLNRRQFFSALLQKGRDTALFLLAESMAPAETSTPATLVDQLNRLQEAHHADNALLVEALQKLCSLYPPAKQRALTRRERETAGCYLCGTCVKLCPAGALTLREESGLPQLSFTAARCLDCGLCQDTCLVGAMRPGRAVTAFRFTDPTSVTIAAAQPQTCSVCGETFFQSPPLPPDPPRCLRCLLAERIKAQRL